MINARRLFWRCTGPQQVRQDLRSTTRRIKEFFDPVTKLATMRTAWASELSGENLRAILSETLRKRLQDSGGQGMEGERDTTATHISTNQLRPDDVLRGHDSEWK